MPIRTTANPAPAVRDEELLRLVRRSERLDPMCIAQLGLQGGERILDVGGAPGTFARAMGRIARRPVVCVDGRAAGLQLAQERAVAEGEQDLIDLRAGTHERLPLKPDEWGTFDLVHCRFLLGQVEGPQGAVERFAHALRPGGRMVLVDDDHELLRMWPSLPAVDELWRAWTHSLRDKGCDPSIGRRLVALLRLAELQPTRCDQLFLGGCAGSVGWDAVAEDFIGLLLGAREDILAGSAIPGELFDEVIESLRGWAGRSDSALWYGVSFAEAVK